MNCFAVLILTLVAVSVPDAGAQDFGGVDEKNMQCKIAPASVPKSWITMVEPCVKKMRDQVREELTAAMTYLAMGAHFARDKVNRPGFAEFFLKSASEEREHAIKVIEYLLMRGELTDNIASTIFANNNPPKPLKTAWDNGLKALEDALELETSVTSKIRSIISECESQSFNDYHLVDYLSGDFLTEQYEGQRDLAGKISTLGKMLKKHGALGEFLFDKKLLNGEV